MSSTSKQPPQVSVSNLNASYQRSTAICQRLFCICYYYSHTLRTISYRIKSSDNGSSGNCIMQHHSRHNNGFFKTVPGASHTQFNRSRFAFCAYEHKVMLWFNIATTIICCLIFIYGVIAFWLSENYLFAVLIYSHVATILICTFVMVLAHIWYRNRIIKATNDLFQLLQAIEKFHGNHGIFEWTHVALVALKALGFVFEICCCLQNLSILGSWCEVAVTTLELYLMIRIWMNIHMVTHFYICIDAMFGSLNHYMRYDFVPRLRAIQSFDPITKLREINRLQADAVKFAGLHERVHKLGQELHYLWQIPIAFTILSVYCGMLSNLYLMIWHYFAKSIFHKHSIPYSVKLTLDIMLLSLTAHRTIKSSRLISWMGLENAVLVENEAWHSEMELFLCRTNLYEFRLSILGLFDLSNALLLNFISGILTSISIFIPFSVQIFRIEKLLRKKH